MKMKLIIMAFSVMWVSCEKGDKTIQHQAEVINFLTNAPVEGANVCMSGLNDKELCSQTDKNGLCEFNVESEDLFYEINNPDYLFEVKPSKIDYSFNSSNKKYYNTLSNKNTTTRIIAFPFVWLKLLFDNPEEIKDISVSSEVLYKGQLLEVYYNLSDFDNITNAISRLYYDSSGAPLDSVKLDLKIYFKDVMKQRITISDTISFKSLDTTVYHVKY